MKSITTVSGDTWDMIAYRVYGNTVYTQDLMEARENVRLLDFEVFPAGIKVYTPDVQDRIESYDLPPWRK